MRTIQARGPQQFVSGRRCEAQRRQAKPALMRPARLSVMAASISVPVAITIKCKVHYGESLRLVGNQTFLGNWNPSQGADLGWSEGNVWRAEAQVPVGSEVDFKVVKVKSGADDVIWEDGDNRSFKILGPEYGLRVTCHWAKPQDMKIDPYKIEQQQTATAALGVAPGVNVNGSGGDGISNGSGQSAQAASRGSNGRSSRDSGGSSGSLSSQEADPTSNGNGRNRSALEEQSAVRGAWVGAEPEFLRSRRQDGGRPGVWRSEGLTGVELALVEGDREAPSWLKKLGLQKRLLVDEPPACRPRLSELAAVYVYATWVNTGALACGESGAHYRPNHHANLALAMFRSLEWVIGDCTRGSGPRSRPAERSIAAARRLHTRLPSFSGEFRASVPLTRIRDIAHRNDIPKDLKEEIKHTLQNKLHRSAGPEDLVATEAMLARITATPGQYPAAFVTEFTTFTAELREFFNATGLVELLSGAGGSRLSGLDDAHASAVRQFLTAKERVEGAGAGVRLEDLMDLMTATTQARSFYAAALVAGLRNDVTDDLLVRRQQWRLADIRLEEFGFVVLSRIISKLEEQGAPAKLPKANNLQWSIPLAALTCGLRHMGLSLINVRELMVLENELQRWHATAPLVETRDSALRIKASLERVLRVAGEYGDMLSEVYGGTAATMCQALGLPEHMGAVFAEAEVRASVAFQVSKLAAMLARAARAAAGDEPWDVLVPGTATGRLIEVPNLSDPAAQQALSETAGANGNGSNGASHNGKHNGHSSGEGVVLVVRRAEGDEELGPLGSRLRGVVLLQELPHLSHLGVRARQDRVPFVTCDDDETSSRVLRPLLGQTVTLTATPDCAVNLSTTTSSSVHSPSSTAATNGNKHAASHTLKPATAATSAADTAPDAAAVRAVDAAVHAGRWADIVVPLAAATPTTCGAKAAKCAVLSTLAAGSNGLFDAPRGAVVPFGVMEAAVAAAGRTAEYEALLGWLDDPRVSGADLEVACGEMRSLVGGLQVPAGLAEQVVNTLIFTSTISTFTSAPALLAIRSSANVEDLAGMAAAGLYDSVVGVPADDSTAVGAAVATVWASLFTRRAVTSRRAAGVRQSSSRMAVLVMEALAPDLSFVLHTARPRDGNPEVLLAEVAPGQGETLAAGTRGSPWRFEVTKSGGAVKTLAFSNFSTALVLPGGKPSTPAFASYGSGAVAAAADAGTDAGGKGDDGIAFVEREVDYGTQRMSANADWRQATVRKMATVGSYIEAAMDGVAQDIEGGVVVRPDGVVQLHVFQTRPQ